MYVLILIGIGGFIGSVFRYFISGLIQNGVISFPAGTMGVNIIGSFLLALTMYASEYQGFFTEETRIFLTIGVLGAFTTMSTFSYESFRLLENNQLAFFGINVAGTIFLSIAAIYLGKLIVGNLWGVM